MDRELIRPCPRPGCHGCGVNECSDCGARTWTPTFDADTPAPVTRPRARISPMLGMMLAMAGAIGPSSAYRGVDIDLPVLPSEGAPGSNPERQRKNAAKRSRKAQRSRRGRR